MKDLHRSLAAAETAIDSLGDVRDARLIAALRGGDFTTHQLDTLYECIEEPLRAAVLVISSVFTGRIYCYLPWEPLSQLAVLIAYPDFELLEPANAEEALDKCRQVLTVSAEVRDPQLLPEYDSRYRIGRGLAQRLVKQWGLDSLKEQARPYRDKPQDEWPLPVIGEADGDRILKLVQTYDEADPPTLLWRKEDGSLLWSLDPTTRRPSTLKGGQM